MPQFEPHQFVAQCQAALLSADPKAAVERIMRETIADPEALIAATDSDGDAIVSFCLSDELTALQVSTAPHIKSPIHNHLTWVVIGMYDGAEHNYFYRRKGNGIELAEERTLRAGDVYVMDENAIHAIVNPLAKPNGALHVYGANLKTQPGRSYWDPDSGKEEPYDFEKLIAFSAEEN